MKLTEYLKDKVLLLLLHMVCMAGLVIFLRLTGYSMDKCVIILVCYGVILAGWLFLQFFSRRSYFRKLEQLTDQLDRRYLLGELMPESFGLEDRKYRELIRKSNKSVIERIHQMEQNQKDYREYIESWVHEIKAPITAIALNCENNRDERSRYLLVENRKVENYVDILFANEEEALAYTGEEPRKATEILSRYCRIAVVKCGAQGSFVGCEGIITEVPATPEVRVDSTGAGDLYASGFLYGLSQNCSLGVCGAIGSLLAGRVIKVIGTKMSDEIWTEIKLKVSSMVAEDIRH